MCACVCVCVCYPAMLLMEMLLDRLVLLKGMMLVCLREGPSVELSSGTKMADRGRSFIPVAETEHAHVSHNNPRMCRKGDALTDIFIDRLFVFMLVFFVYGMTLTLKKVVSVRLSLCIGLDWVMLC